MLKFLRKRKNIRRIMLAGAILIIPTFLLWGVGSAVRGKKTQDLAGTIFDRKVSIKEFYKSFNVIRDRIIRNYGMDLPQEFIIDMTWERLILLQEAQRRGIKIDNNEISAEIKKLPQFQDKQGVFDLALYKERMQDRARAFEEEIRNDLLIHKLKEDVSNRVGITAAEIEQGYKNLNEKVVISYILVPPESFKDKITVSDEEMNSFYNSHIQNFKKPLEVNLEYVELTPELIDKIEEPYEKVKGLKELSRLFGLETKETGFFGPQDPIPGIGFSLPIHQEAFQLKIGQLSRPMETPKGYIIITPKQMRRDYIPALTEIKEKIQDSVFRQKTKEMAKQTAENYYGYIKNKLTDNPSLKFEALTQEFGTELKTTSQFSRKDYITGLGIAEKLKEAAFGMETGGISEVLEVETGFCIFRLEQKIPIDKEKFEAEKDTFSMQLLNDRQQEYFNRWFELLKAQANLKSNL